MLCCGVTCGEVDYPYYHRDHHHHQLRRRHRHHHHRHRRFYYSQRQFYPQNLRKFPDLMCMDERVVVGVLEKG